MITRRSAWAVGWAVGALVPGPVAVAGASTDPAGSAAAAAAPAPGPADEAYWTLPTVRVEADRLPDPLGPFPLATTRLGPDAVERVRGETLGALLQPVVGVRVSARGVGASGISIRGSTSDQVLVLVDGRRWQTSQGGGADLSTLSLDSVESVEVFRGGASALWGSDAVGGAVHVRTRRPHPGDWRLRVGGGSHGERSAAGEVSAGLGPSWRGRIGGRWFDTDADYSFSDDRRATESQVRNGDVRRADADARLEGALPGAGRLRLDFTATEGDRGVPGSEEFPSPSARLEDRQWTAGARWSGSPTARWQPALDVAGMSRTQRYHEKDAPFGPIDDRHENVRVRAEASLDRLGERTSVRVAAGAALDELDSSTDGTPSRNSVDARVQATADGHLGPRSVRAMGALRVDGTRGFDPFWSPRLGVLVELLPGRVSARASAGLSYRAPSFDELFWPARATAAGNPDLQAERGRDLDVGLTWTGANDARGALDAFVRQVDDLIQWIPGASGVWRPHNIGSARLAGLEADASFAVPGFRDLVIGAGGTYLHSEDRSGETNVDGRRLVYRPRWSGILSARAPMPGGGELESEWRFVDDVFVTRANTQTLPGFSIVDLRYHHPLGTRLGLDAAVSNLTDRTARDFRDYPLPGRSWKLGLTYRRTSS